MATFSTRDYDALESAITAGRRLAIFRRGTEYLVIPTRLFLRAGREAIEAVHPTTGDVMAFGLDEIDSFEVVR
jgi:predicted DNA-binding transcriptional regulator YafY